MEPEEPLQTFAGEIGRSEMLKELLERDKEDPGRIVMEAEGG